MHLLNSAYRVFDDDGMKISLITKPRDSFGYNSHLHTYMLMVVLANTPLSSATTRPFCQGWSFWLCVQPGTELCQKGDLGKAAHEHNLFLCRQWTPSTSHLWQLCHETYKPVSVFSIVPVALECISALCLLVKPNVVMFSYILLLYIINEH